MSGLGRLDVRLGLRAGSQHELQGGQHSYAEAFDSEWKGDLCIFGESVLFREAAGRAGQMAAGRVRKKVDLQWHRGIYLGRAEATNEHIVGNSDGICLTRNVRQLPAD